MRAVRGVSSGEYSRPRLQRMHDVLRSHVARGDMPGLVALVSRCGETHVEALGQLAFEGNAPMSRDSIFRIASMSKPITAAAAMILVEDGTVALDEPVARFLPELAEPRVLKSLESPVSDTVPAVRPITVRHLLTFTMGTGAVMAFPPKYPIQQAQIEAGVAPGPDLPDFPADEFMRRIGSLPLVYQPGERWLYHTGSDVLGVLIARASGGSLGDFLRERLFEPLGMVDTGFEVPVAKLDRLSSSYRRDPKENTLVLYDDARASRWSRPPKFEAGGGGLVSTADDYLAFLRMMLNKGLAGAANGRERVLSRAAVELMMSDQLTAGQKLGTEIFFGQGAASWGLGGAVVLRRTHLYATPGRYGWDGGYGTSAHADPAEDLVGVLLTQRMMESPEPPRVFTDFWTTAYAAIND